MSRCALYRHFDAEGALLYIGVSANPAGRLLTHVQASSPWVQSIARIDVVWLASREEAHAAEAAAIAEEQPPFNISGSNRPVGIPRCEGPSMLAAWLDRTGTAPEQLAKDVGSTPFAVRRIAQGKRRPYTKVARRIEAVTQGAVPASVWFAGASA